MIEENHILSILVDNEPGVLSRITGLFSGRGYNIESLGVAETTSSKISRITMITKADTVVIEQIKKQLHKLINVIKVNELTNTDHIERELVLVKVHASSDNRAEILRIADIFRSKVIDVGQDHYTVEITGNKDKISACMNLLKPMGIKEIARTGSVALPRK